MGLLELLIVVVLLFWLFGYFGRGRFYGSRGGTAVNTGWASSPVATGCTPCSSSSSFSSSFAFLGCISS